MMTEGVHSLVDSGNQLLLLYGQRRAGRPPDRAHPFGYGRDAFIWALMSAVGVFFLGCGVSVAHGVQSLLEHHAEIQAGQLAIGILVFSLVVEGMTLAVAVRAMMREARERSIGFFENLRTTDDPFGFAVLLEDGAAVFGVLVALAALILTEMTGNAQWDSIGTLLVGVLLGAVALILIHRNRLMLLGRAVRPEESARIEQTLLGDAAVQSVALSRATVAGVDDYRVSVELVLDAAELVRRYEARLGDAAVKAGDDAQLDVLAEGLVQQVGIEIDRLEDLLRTVIPRAGSISLEPDAGLGPAAKRRSAGPVTVRAAGG